MVVYDYLFLLLAPQPSPHAALAEVLRTAELELAEAGGRIVGQFAPQLGWWNDEAAVLIRWTGEPADLAVLDRAKTVLGFEVRRLRATLRPADNDALRPGGIYVHRWFWVEPGSVDEFVALSGEGWKGFEAQFDAAIFGLFCEEAPSGDVARLLLVTRYADHGVWEASRDPSTEAMRIFARRQQLTRRTWAASTRLVAP
jgi:hypothetical protein